MGHPDSSESTARGVEDLGEDNPAIRAAPSEQEYPVGGGGKAFQEAAQVEVVHDEDHPDLRDLCSIEWAGTMRLEAQAAFLSRIDGTRIGGIAEVWSEARARHLHRSPA